MTTSNFAKKVGVFLLIALLLSCASKEKKSSDDAEEMIDPNTPETLAQNIVADKKGYIEFVGHIEYVPLEGGFYGIIASGRRFDPVALPKKYQEEGLRVKIRARLRKDWVSSRQWGELIHVVKIKALDRKTKPPANTDNEE